MKVSSLHFLYNVTGVSFTPADNGQDAKFKYAFPHLALGVFYIHTQSVFYLPSSKNVF
jgi:hypothetical protein